METDNRARMKTLTMETDNGANQKRVLTYPGGVGKKKVLILLVSNYR